MKEDNSLLTWEGYYDRFCFYVGEGYTHTKAYELTQEELESYYGKVNIKGYSSYESFKTAVHKKHNKK